MRELFCKLFYIKRLCSFAQFEKFLKISKIFDFFTMDFEKFTMDLENFGERRGQFNETRKFFYARF